MMMNEKELLAVANEMMNAIHKDEVEIINGLYQALLNGDKEAVDRLVLLLLEDVEEHLCTEEEMMKEAEFFAYPMHETEHDSMRKDLKDVADAWFKEKDTKSKMGCNHGFAHRCLMKSCLV